MELVDELRELYEVEEEYAAKTGASVGFMINRQMLAESTLRMTTMQAWAHGRLALALREAADRLEAVEALATALDAHAAKLTARVPYLPLECNPVAVEAEAEAYEDAARGVRAALATAPGGGNGS